MTDLDKELEKALSGKSTNDEVAPLADTAETLRGAFSVEVPEARAEQLLFTNGAGLRKRSALGFRLLIPAVALGSFLLAIVLVGRTAPPGGSLYPVRGALQAVGLAEGPVKEVQEELVDARHSLALGEKELRRSEPADAVDEAFDALDSLEDARELLPDLSREQRAVYEARIDSLELQAKDLIQRAVRAEDREERREDNLEDDNSGSGSDDSGGDDDNSGSGSDDDNSGSGSDDSGSDDDNSGSGSDDNSGSGGGDDSSGSGSSGSGSDDDSSGSGSG